MARFEINVIILSPLSGYNYNVAAETLIWKGLSLKFYDASAAKYFQGYSEREVYRTFAPFSSSFVKKRFKYDRINGIAKTPRLATAPLYRRRERFTQGADGDGLDDFISR